ncbi:MAG: hypothetical protein AAB381_02130 [Patescibacteria group bacterium]
MNTKKKRRNNLRPVTWTIITIVILATGFALLHNKKSVPVATSPVVNMGNSSYSSDELKSFWSSELKPIAVDQWAGAQFPYPEINARSAHLKSRVLERTQKGIRTHASFNYHWAGKTISATTGFNTNEHQVTFVLHVPALLDTFKEVRGSGRADWRKLFETYFTIMLMHEMEHAGYDGRSATAAVTKEEESRAWAETCRHTITPLVELYNLPTFQIQNRFYVAWKLSNGDTGHPAWQEVLESVYGLLDNLPHK